MKTKVSGAVSISSLLVGARPAAASAVRTALEAMAGVEFHAMADDGRMIVTVESDTEAATVDIVEAIGRLPGVLSVAMVYHQYESNPDEEA